MKKTSAITLLSLIILLSGFINVSAKDKPEYYQLIVFHFTSKDQEKILDNYLEKALLPTLHRNKIENIGVFKPIANDTAANKVIYVYINAKSLELLAGIPSLLETDANYKTAAKEYLDAAYNAAPFTRYETILMKAFRLALKMNLPNLKSAKAEHIYELRSYESPTDALYWNKVKMFNEGDEIGLFKRLNFNAVFYADVISGSRMPNLIYMTSFENMQERDAHWKSFVDDAEWKRLSTLPEYQHNVSKADIILMHAAPYSDF